MSEIGKAEVQKMYDAQANVTRAEAAKKDPLVALNPETGNFFFKNEYERGMFLAGLEAPQVAAAIEAVKGDKVGLSPTEKTDYLRVLGDLQKDFDASKRKVRADLRNEALVINATIPGPNWEKSGKEVTVEGKKYGVEKREGSVKGKSDLKIDAGLTASVLVKDVPDGNIDDVISAYQNANKKDAKDNSLLKSGWFGRTVKYEEIKSLVESKPVAAPAQVVETSNQTIDLNKEGWTLNKDNKLEKDGKLFSGKGKFVKEGKDGYTAEGTYKDGVLIDGTMKYQDRVRSGKFDPNTGKLIDGYRQFNDNKGRVEGKFDKDTGYLLDGTYITKEGAVYKGTWNNKGENFSGTITALDGKVTKWENGKEEIQSDITSEQFSDVQFMLAKSAATTSTVRKNAEAIVTALKMGTKLADIKDIVANLQDRKAKIEDFQKLLGRPQDGTIGSGDILALLRKAGVADNQIPQVIKDKTGNEGKAS